MKRNTFLRLGAAGLAAAASPLSLLAGSASEAQHPLYRRYRRQVLAEFRQLDPALAERMERELATPARIVQKSEGHLVYDCSAGNRTELLLVGGKLVVRQQ